MWGQGPQTHHPQWVGELGVEAVVVLAIDDLSGNTALYETYLRPILERLKKIDGRAGLSIMTCKADGADPRVGPGSPKGSTSMFTL